MTSGDSESTELDELVEYLKRESEEFSGLKGAGAYAVLLGRMSACRAALCARCGERRPRTLLPSSFSEVDKYGAQTKRVPKLEARDL